MKKKLLATTITLLSLASIAGAQIRFNDITALAGVSYLQNSPSVPGSGALLAMTGGAAAGDVDGDGWVDLFVTRINGNSRLFRNLGVNGGGVHLGFENVASTSFIPSPPASRMNGAAFADVDGDGDLDLMLTGIATPSHYLWMNDGTGQFVEEGATRGLSLPGNGQHQGFSASFGDFDLDGYLDLYVTEWGHVIDTVPPLPSRSRLLRNMGAANPGYYEDVTDAAGVGLEDSIPTGPGSGPWQGVYSFTPKFADFDDDGWPDLAIAGDFGTSRLFWNNQDGTFTDGTIAAAVAGDENGMGAAVGDFNGDGNLDWFVTSIYDPLGTCGPGLCNWANSGNRLYLGDGARNFTDATDLGVRDGGWGWGATDIDFDNDGRLDIAMTNGIKFTMSAFDDPFNDDMSKIFRFNGADFDDVGYRIGVRDTLSGKGILKLDFDRDGDEDMFVTNAVDRPVLYRNEGGNNRKWLQVDLQGSGANTFGIGARVLLWPDEGDAPLVREQSASSNYLSQNETLLHFGLNQDTLVDRLEVHWPGGAVSVLEDVAAEQRIVVMEP
ncbi:MAG: hypothetical protein ACI8X5_001150 [Planctomycetota bacterium]|jgi:hypothetical protein